MASGVPVVSSDASCLPEVAGEAALLADPSETGELTEALLRLWEDQELRAGECTAEKFGRRLVEFYDGMEEHLCA